MSWHVVVYDIPHDGRRRKLHDRLKALLKPVQYSCFEGDLGARGLRSLQGLVRRWLCDPGERLHVYTLCDTCRQRTQVLAGTDPTLPLPWTLGGTHGGIPSAGTTVPPAGGTPP